MRINGESGGITPLILNMVLDDFSDQLYGMPALRVG